MTLADVEKKKTQKALMMKMVLRIGDRALENNLLISENKKQRDR